MRQTKRNAFLYLTVFVAVLMTMIMASSIILPSLVLAADADSSLSVSKTITWTPGSNNAEIEIISNVPDKNETQVLFLGTLCGAHGMSRTNPNTVTDSLNAIAKNADITYYLLNSDESKKTYKGTTGTMERGDVLTKDPASISTGGNHSSLKGFLNVLYTELITNGNGYDSEKSTRFDYIVLEFDESRIAASFSGDDSGTCLSGYSLEKLNTLATELQKYYENGKVIWITDGRKYNGSTKSPIYDQLDGYTPTNEYMTGGDGSINRLSAERFRALCAMVAPKYFLAHKSTTEEFYGNGSASFTLQESDYTVLPTITRTQDNAIDPTSYYKARQLTYADASSLSEFLYMVIPGVTLHFTDKIVFSKDVTVTNVNVYVTENTTTASASWSTRVAVDVSSLASTNLKSKESGTKYVTNAGDDSQTIIEVTTGNADASLNNSVDIVAEDVKNKVKFIKVVIKLTSTNKFADCINLIVDESGNPVLDGKGNFQYEMNPNDGPVSVSAFSGGKGITGTAVATGSSTASAPAVNIRKITSKVTGGTKSQEGGNFKTGESELNPYTIYSADYKTVTTKYTPDTGKVLEKITIDNTSYTLDSFKTSSTITGTGYKVTLNNDGTVSVEFAELAADHSVETSFVSGVSLEKSVDKTTAVAGDEITYTLKIVNKTANAVSGLKISDVLPTGLTFVSASDSGANSSGTVTWSNLSVAANSTKSVTVKAKIDPTITKETTYKNVGVLKDSTDKEIYKTPEENEKSEVKASPRTITVKYSHTGTVPADVSVPSDGSGAYGSKFTADTQTGKAGWIFDGWYTDSQCKNKYTNGTELTKENFPALESGDDITLYGQWTYGLSMTKKVDKTAASGGDTLIYTITIKNKSKGAVTNYEVTDILNENLVYVSSATTSATKTLTFTETTRTLSATNLTIPAEGSITITITTTVDKKVTDSTTVTNTAKGKESGQEESPKYPVIEPEDVPETTIGPRTIEISYHYTNTAPNGAKIPANETSIKYGEKYIALAGSTETLTNAAWFDFSGWYIDENLQTKYDSTKSLTEDNYSELSSGKEIKLYGAWTPKYAFTITKDAKFGNPEESIANKFALATSTIKYEIVVKNNNPEVKTTISFVDVVPSGLTVENSTISDNGVLSQGVITWSDIEVSAGGTVTVSFNVTIPEDLASITEYKNVAYVTENNDIPYDGEGSEEKKPGTVTFKGMPAITYYVCGEWSDSGSWTTHLTDKMLVHLYAGSDVLKNIELTSDLQEYQILLPIYTEEGDKIVYFFKEYLAGTPEIIVNEGEKSGDYKVNYKVIDDDTYTYIFHDYAFKTSDFEFGKKANAKVDAGSQFTYTITLKNLRNVETAKNISITDTIPTGLKVISVVDENKNNIITVDEGTYTWKIVSLSAEAEAKLVITVEVPSDVKAMAYTNIAKLVKIDDETVETPKDSPKATTTVREFDVSKEWIEFGEQVLGDDKLPVLVQLLKNGVECGDLVELSPENEWKYTWKQLDLVDEQGIAYVYTVDEVEIEHYTTEIEYDEDSKSEDYGDTKAIITNTLIYVTVKYNFGGDVPEFMDNPEDMIFEIGLELTNTDVMVPEKYIFVGWFLDPDYEIPYIEGSEINEDMELYGYWEEVPETGDSDMTIWYVVIGVSMVVLCIMPIIKKKKA